MVSSDKVKHPLDPGARGWSTEVSNNVEDLITEMDRTGEKCATLMQPNATYGLDNPYRCDSAKQYAPRTVAVGILDPAASDAADKLHNACLRISSTSVGPYADQTPPEKELFRRVIEAFTPRRVMWGSNFPSSREGGYIGQVQLGQTALPWLSDEDRSWIMGETAHKLWPMLHAPARG